MKAGLAIIGIFLLAYVLGSWLKPTSVNQGELFISDCDPNRQLCQFTLDNQLLSFGFSGAASPLTPFTVELSAAQSLIEGASVSFEMQGMDMGYNQHPLILQQNIWSAQVILPVCTLGRNDWVVKLAIQTANKNIIHEFKFVQTQTALQ